MQEKIVKNGEMVGNGGEVEGGMIDYGKAWETAIAVLLAVAGGFARLLYLKDSIKLGWGRVLSELFIAGFSGLMALMIVRAGGISGEWVGVLAGMSGWFGPKILDIMSKIVLKFLGKSFNIEFDTQENKP